MLSRNDRHAKRRKPRRKPSAKPARRGSSALDHIVDPVHRFRELTIALDGLWPDMVFSRKPFAGFWLGVILTPNLRVLIFPAGIRDRLLLPVVPLAPQIARLIGMEVAAAVKDVANRIISSALQFLTNQIIRFKIILLIMNRIITFKP